MLRFFWTFIFAQWVLIAPLHAVGILRDAEFENALDQLAKPIFQVAGLPAEQYSILIVDDPSPNAFVLTGRYIFIHKGLILRCRTAPMLQAVMAHEIAHLTSQHHVNRSSALRSAKTGAMLGIALGVLVETMAGADHKGIGVGTAMGISSSSNRNFFAHTRAQESSADQLGAAYLRRAGIPLQGMVDVMALFEGQEGLSERSQDVYVRTHPLSRERVKVAKGFAKSDTAKQSSQEAQFWFERLRAGLAAFDGRRKPNGLSAEGESYYNAIRAFRRGDTPKAVAQLNALSKARPNDGYLKIRIGEVQLASGQASAALKNFQAALKRKSDPVVLQYAGRAAFVAGKHKLALDYFEQARRQDGLNPSLFRDMALAYGQLGETGKAALATAERYAATNKPKDAQIQAKRAQNLLVKHSPSWQRAQDIIDYAQEALKK